MSSLLYLLYPFISIFFFFFFNDTATTEIYTLSLHDALPICLRRCDAGVSSLQGLSESHRLGDFVVHKRVAARISAPDPRFDAFSRREPVSTSLENAIERADRVVRCEA